MIGGALGGAFIAILGAVVLVGAADFMTWCRRQRN
jgi:hypothetical protein